MQPDFKGVFGKPIKVDWSAPWRWSSVSLGLKLAVLYAPTTITGLVLLPIGTLLWMLIDNIWDVIKGALMWAASTVIVLVLGFAGALTLEDEKSS